MNAGRVVIGVGSEFRRDDGFGPGVVAELARRVGADQRLDGVDLRVADGEPTRLFDAWAGASLAVLIDVADAGETRCGGWLQLEVPGVEEHHEATAGTHRIGLGTTVALARALQRLPGRLVILVAYGHEFGFGTELSTPLAAAVAPVADRVCELVAPDGAGHGSCLTAHHADDSGGFDRRGPQP